MVFKLFNIILDLIDDLKIIAVNADMTPSGNRFIILGQKDCIKRYLLAIHYYSQIAFIVPLTWPSPPRFGQYLASCGYEGDKVT